MFKILKAWGQAAKLRSKDDNVRNAAAKALGELGGKWAVRPLIKALSGHGPFSYDPWVPAANALVKIGPRAVEPLIRAMGDKGGRIRAAAASVLGWLGNLRAIEPLIKALSDEEGQVRYSASTALGTLGDERAVEPLIKALSDQYNAACSAAARALGEFGDPRAVEPLIRVLRERQPCDYAGAPSDSVYACGAAAEALGRIGDKRAVEPLIKALHASYFHIRTEAAEALGRIGDPRGIEPLICLLIYDDKHFQAGDLSRVANVAAEALVKIGPHSAESLTKVLGNGSGRIRRTVAEVLAKIGESTWQDIVKGEGEDWLRLGACDDPRGFELLIRAFSDRDSSTREAVAVALGRLGDKRAVDPLIRTLGDGFSGDVRKAAATALAAIGEPKWQEIVKGDIEDFERLGACGDPRAFESVLNALNCRGYPVKGTVARALGSLGDTRAVEPLIDVLCRPPEDCYEADACIAAAEALGVLGGSCAIEALADALSSARWQSIRLAAAEALAKIASLTPSDIGKRWSFIRERVAQPHHDVSGSCGSHVDSGIGLEFPPPPTGLDF
jgi:HEAT repeat protein